jgi:hypothetical protein
VWWVIYWVTIGVVVFASLILIIVLVRKRHGRDPLALVASVMAVLALLLAVGSSIQTTNDQAQVRSESQRRDTLIATLIGVVAEIQRDQANRDLPAAVRAQRLAQNYQRYNAIRTELASILGRPAPPPIKVPAQLGAAANTAAVGNPAAATTTGAPAPQRPVSRPRGGRRPGTARVDTTTPPPPAPVATTPPPPPPPPLM